MSTRSVDLLPSSSIVDVHPARKLGRTMRSRTATGADATATESHARESDVNSPLPSTHWSAILQAAGADPDRARRAFEQLCADYRDAIVRWMVLQNLSRENAEDAAHDFLAQWLQRENP